MSPDADVAAQVADQAASLRELSGTVAELGGQQATHSDELTRLDNAVQAMLANLGALADEITQQARDDDDRTAVAWQTLDREQASEQWDKLLDWLETTAATYTITREQIPDCWPRHPAMRNELSWLRTLHHQGHVPGSGGLAEWHLRYLPGVLDRIAAHITRTASLQRHRCGNGTCRGELIHDEQPTPEQLEQVTTPAVWCHDGITRDLDTRE